jgi:DNA repair exonuclease SbcCD ATPase subunit
MRILELDIQNVRGIRDLKLFPDGKNIAIWGPNGSGKSAVVDAIDFLLTGRITRLTGKGTASLSLAKHGPHIDNDASSAVVTAKLKLNSVATPIELSRSIANPNTLICDPSNKAALEPILSLAKRGQHVLTRREILRFVTAEPSARATEIQELLDLTEIESARKALVRVHNEAEKELQGTKRLLQTAQAAINATIQEKTYQANKVLEAININRALLGAAPISNLESAMVKSGTSSPGAMTTETQLNLTLLKRDISSAKAAVNEAAVKSISSADSILRQSISAILKDPTLLQALSSLELNKLGLKLLGEKEICPLCGAPWPAGKLKEVLERKIQDASTAEKHNKAIIAQSNQIIQNASQLRSFLANSALVARSMKLESVAGILDQWTHDIDTLVTELTNPLDNYTRPTYTSDQVSKLLSTSDRLDALSSVESTAISLIPQSTPEQLAWDLLTRLEENLKAVESATRSVTIAQTTNERASLLLSSFEQSRDHVLTSLYDSIRDRFVELYKHLHGPDEHAFVASLTPDGAGLDLQVDFYGHGTHPPHALHSESHQDSMGICLYLALAEKLTAGIIDLVIFDDVVMSVDSDHRLKLCSLLTKFFPHRQFVITTHDLTWATQLKTEGVVDSKRVFEFFNWSIQAGPQVNFETDLWSRIDEDLVANDVHTAAAHLRRASEQYFASVCDALRAPVIYKLSGRWELGDYLPSAMSQLKKIMKLAKDVASKWKRNDIAEEIAILESTISSVFSRSQVEQWAINANVHYSKWPDFSTQDFLPVVQAFRDLFALYQCSQCSGILHITMRGNLQESLRCNCGKVNWNLVPPS